MTDIQQPQGGGKPSFLYLVALCWRATGFRPFLWWAMRDGLRSAREGAKRLGGHNR